MKEELKALGERMVAWSGWRWMPGMDGLVGSWTRVHIVGADEDDPHTFVADGDNFSHCNGDWEDYDDAIPNMSSPATLGLIEELILEHPVVGHLQTHRTSEGDASIYLHGLEAEEIWRIEQVRRAEALVAAVEAIDALGGLAERVEAGQ